MSDANPKYYRLVIDEEIVGYKRITVEYIHRNGSRWQLEPISHEDSFYVTAPPMGISKLPRPRVWYNK